MRPAAELPIAGLRVPLLRAALAVVTCTLTVCAAGAAEGPRISVSPAYEAPRTQAPLLLDVHVAWDNPTLLEGRVELDFYVERRLVHRWRSRPLALASTLQQLRCSIPSIVLLRENDTIDIDAAFVGSRGVTREDLHVPYWLDTRRVWVLGIVHPARTSAPPADFVTQQPDKFAWSKSFRLDEYLPVRAFTRHLSVRPVQVDAERFPDHALQLLGFDVLVLTSDGFAELLPRQLQAIADWVEAGGSVCVAGASVRTPEQRRFLERLTESNVAEPRLQFDGQNVQPAEPLARPWLSSSPGIGAATLTFSPVDVDAADWRDEMLRLWRVNQQQRRSVLQSGQLNFGLEDGIARNMQNPFYYPLQPQAGVSGQLPALLLPNEVAGVPLTSVMLILSVCLLAIGPGDYFLLGWLRRRRWTWLLFPVISLMATAVTVLLAQNHLGQVDQRTSLVFVDLNRDGVPVKSSEYELVFAAAQRTEEREESQSWRTPLLVRQTVELDEFGYPSGNRVSQRNEFALAPAEPELMEGPAPVHYTLSRTLRQWQPTLSRETTFGPAITQQPPAFDWSRLTSDLIRDDAALRGVCQEMQAAVPGGEVVLLRDGKPLAMDEQESRFIEIDASQSTYQPRTLVRDLAIAATAPRLDRFAGVYSIVSRVAPQANGDMEDLMLIDPHDVSESALLWIVPHEGGYVVYRRLFRDVRRGLKP